MSSTATSLAAGQRLEMLFDEIAELCGQRNAIDGRLVQIVAELEREELAGLTGARSMSALVAWKTGVAPRNAETVVAVARRLQEFPRCTEALREGRLSLDQVGVIAERAAAGSDAHYAELAAVATVSQLRTAITMEPRPDPETPPESGPEVTTTSTGERYTTYRIRLPRLEAAKFDAALQSHHDALIAEAKGDAGEAFPTRVDAFMSLVEAGWDSDVARRPHGQHTTVVVHLDVEKPAAALHLGPVLSEGERRYLLCDAICEVWFERHGQPIGAGRTTRTISRRLRRALEHRDRCCVVPGCGATRGLHAHHLTHWEDGGYSNLDNLVPPYPGPTGERAQWWWYQPFEPPPGVN
ncbi:HNH endonuclease signature motif containing protein [Mycolicibacterium sp. Y3]